MGGKKKNGKRDNEKGDNEKEYLNVKYVIFRDNCKSFIF